MYVKLALVAATWGSTFIAGRIVSAQMSAPVAALGRFVIATATLLLLVLVLEHGLPRLSWRKWLQFTLLGAIGVATYALLFMYALQTVTASRGALIMALIPAATLVGGALFLHESLTRPRVLGIALALIGVAVDLGDGNPLRMFTGPVGIGEIAMFGCVLAWSAYTLLGKRVLGEGMSPLVATTFAALTGTVILAHRKCRARRPRAAESGLEGLAVARVHGRARDGHRVLLVLRRRENDRSRRALRFSSISFRWWRSFLASCCSANR